VAISAEERPSPARWRIWRSRSESGSASALQASAARSGSMERRPAGSGVERATQIASAGEGGEDDDAGLALGLLERGGKF